MIRKADIPDAAAVAQMAMKMWSSHSYDELLSEFEALLASKKAAVFLCVEDEKAIGFSFCTLRNDYVEGTSSSPVGYLEGVFVDEKYRKSGIGKSLVSSCEKWAMEMGCLEFASDCELNNIGSLDFHLSAGFREVNRTIHFAKLLR